MEMKEEKIVLLTDYIRFSYLRQKLAIKSYHDRQIDLQNNKN
jgi:hypothetical protein